MTRELYFDCVFAFGGVWLLAFIANNLMVMSRVAPAEHSGMFAILEGTLICMVYDSTEVVFVLAFTFCLADIVWNHESLVTEIWVRHGFVLVSVPLAVLLGLTDGFLLCLQLASLCSALIPLTEVVTARMPDFVGQLVLFLAQLSRFLVATYIFVVSVGVAVNGYASERFTGRETIALASWSLAGFVLHQFWLIVQWFACLLSSPPAPRDIHPKKPRDTNYCAIDLHHVS